MQDTDENKLLQEVQKALELVQSISTSTDLKGSIEFRKMFLQLQAASSAGLGATADNTINTEILEEYIKDCMESSYLLWTRLPPVPSELVSKINSKVAKASIQNIASSYIFEEENPLLKKINTLLISSRSIADLRRNLNLWVLAVQQSKELSSTRTELMKAEQVIHLDADREEQILELKRINEELIQALEQDDADTALAMQVHKLKAQGKGRRAIAEELGISERKTTKLLKEYSFEFSVGAMVRV